jgi:exosortase
MTGARSRLNAAPALVCALAGIALFQFWGNSTHGYIATNSLFYWWGFQWVNPESETEHAWLVLALSIFLFWRNLRRLPPNPQPAPSRAGSAIGFALLLHAAGFVAQQPRISIIALLLYAWGVLTLEGGCRWGGAAAFPLAFMVFAIPVNALDTVGFWLRMWVVQAGERIAHFAGIGVLRNGTQLLSPDGRYQYDVVAACSGMRSLMALAALSLFIGYLWFRPAWVRGAILILSPLLVYVGNVVRISAIVFAAQWGGQVWGDRVHDLMGFGVFIIVLGGVIAVADVVARRWPALTTDGPVRSPQSANGVFNGLGPSSVAAIVLAAVAAEVALLAHLSSFVPEEKPGVILARDSANPVELPTFLGSNWMGRTVEPTEVERAILPPDTGYSRKLYFNLDDPKQHVLLSIVLSGRDRTSIHRPELCLVGQGWTIDGSSLHRFSYPGLPNSSFESTILRVHRVLSGPHGRALAPELVAYWFVGDDRVVPTQVGRMYYDTINRLFRGRAARWAYILLQTGAEDGQDAGLSRIQAILNGALPSFQNPIAFGAGGGGGR